MKTYLSGVILFSVLFSASAKPGEPYVLTGKEKSVFGIFQADMKAYPELYKGADVNACYAEFKKLNNLDGGRKLKLGEALQFPHTEKSRELASAEKAAAERAARQEAAAAQPEAPAAETADSGELFGADRRGAYDAELRRKQGRQQAVLNYQLNRLPRMLFSMETFELTDEALKELSSVACSRVDEDFAEALQLHRYPEKGIWILEFETPEKQSGLFFFAAKTDADGTQRFYALEKGLSVFGAGHESKLTEWKSEWNTVDLGGRPYSSLTAFLAELDRGVQRIE